MRRSSGRISSRISPRTVSRFDESSRNGEAVLLAVASRVGAPDAEQRADDAVLALRLDALRAFRSSRAGRGSSRPGPRACGRWRGGGRSRSRSGSAAARLRSRRRAPSTTSAPRRSRQKRASSSDSVAAQAVVHVQRRDGVAELAEHVPEAGRVGAAGDEDGDGRRPERSELFVPDERLDALAQLSSLGIGALLPLDGPGIQPGRRSDVARRRAGTLPVAARVGHELLRRPAEQPQRRRASFTRLARRTSPPGASTAASSSARASRYGCACATSGTRRAGAVPVLRGEHVRDRQRVDATTSARAARRARAPAESRARSGR